VIIYSRELILSVLFNKESCDSPHRVEQGVTNVWIFCRNSGLPFSTGSLYSQCCLIWRVKTPYIVYSGESLTTAGSLFLKQFWRTPPASKGTLKQNLDYACRALLTRNIKRE
jgi:hypothetical protein